MQLYTIFHLNLAFSSVEESQRSEIIERCYWPILNLASQYGIPFGIETSGYTLETIQSLDSAWLDEFKRLIECRICEPIGSGYAQLIGPLVPAQVNQYNLRLGNQIYEKHLGIRPQIALVNEQAYASGLIENYLDADYSAIIMEWENPARCHPEWNKEWRYLPQFACNQHGNKIPIIWNQSIPFQKFQRYVHREIELEEYLLFLTQHIPTVPSIKRAMPLYGNDVEIFDFRPGRYKTEADLVEGEWKRIEKLLHSLLDNENFSFVLPSNVLNLMGEPEAGNCLQLESAEQPIPVKKQGKYNISRWAVTGRDDLGINTACYRIFQSLVDNKITESRYWQELCYLWSSDFRTHITEQRWVDYCQRLTNFERELKIESPSSHIDRDCQNVKTEIDNLPSNVTVKRDGNYLKVQTPEVIINLNCRRGLTIDKLWFPTVSEQWLCGTLPHGYYDDINWGADYYTGHLIFETYGQPKITDLNFINPKVYSKNQYVYVLGKVDTVLGPIYKQLKIALDQPTVNMSYQLDWSNVPIGSLRLGSITLNPDAFNQESLYYQTHNGGSLPERFELNEKDVDHGRAFSPQVSTQCGLGITSGEVQFGDNTHTLQMCIPKSKSALVGQISYCNVKPSYFCRLMFSGQEIDETYRVRDKSNQFCISLNIQAY